MDHPYTFWEQTPLKWHKFVTYVGLPLGLVANICSLPSLLETISGLLGSGVAWLGMIDLLYTLFYIILSAAAICGNLPRNRKWFGPQCTIALYAVSALYLAFIILLSILFQTWEESLASNLGPFLVYAIGAWLVAIYYRKRRLLFRPMPGVSQHRAGAAPQPDVPSAQPAVCDSSSVPQQEEPVQACSSASPSAPVPPSGMAASRASRPFSKKVLFGCAFFLLELLLLSGCYLCASKMVEAQMQADITKSYYDGWAKGYQAGVEDGKSLSRELNLSEERLERYQQANETIAKRDAEWERFREEY